MLLLGFMLKGNLTHERFDSTMWKSWTETESEPSLRWDMLNNLRNSHELKGKSSHEIIELLGNPDSKSDLEFSYYLGYSHHGINTGRLTLFFDATGFVLDFTVNQG